MKATATNTRSQCERCRKVKPFVLACAFQGDGTATFRFLCGSCERMERARNQPALFGRVRVFETVEEAIEEIEHLPEPPKPKAQMDLFQNWGSESKVN